jgi:PAS domain S-box-containing protein
VVDTKYKIVLFNRAAELISGVALSEAVGKSYKNIFKLVDDSSEASLNDFMERAIKQNKVERLSDKAVLMKSDGLKLPVSGNAAPLWNHEGIILGCVVVLRDVSREREVDKMKTEFISITSHQMRTPLSTINWYLEALLTGQAGELNEDQTEFISQINIGNARLIKIVNSILNISRIEAGRLKIEPEPTDVVEWLKSEIKEVEPLAKQGSVEIKINWPQTKMPLVSLDQGLWQQVVHNFLTNAIKYSIDSTNKEVTISLAVQGKDFVISVKDSGMGIPKEAQAKIFQKFYRAKNAMHSDADGNGLGLYVAKMIADLSGGRLWFESEENKGTTFYASLPLVGMKKREGDRKLETV